MESLNVVVSEEWNQTEIVPKCHIEIEVVPIAIEEKVYLKDKEETSAEEKEPKQTPKTPTKYVQKSNIKEHIFGDKNKGVQTRRLEEISEHTNYCFVSQVEPKTYADVSKDESWIKAMEEELNQIENNQTWELVPRPVDKNVIGTKWVFWTKLNEGEKVTRNKTRLVCKGYSQDEVIDFKETFA